MKRLTTLLAVAAVSLAACGKSSSSSSPAPTPFPKPAGYVAVSLRVDDRLNKVFANNELAWKGNMTFQGETNRIITPGTGWAAPYPPLYDDGPWDQGGHEPAGEVAGDHIFGTTVYIKPPTAAGTNVIVGYGLTDAVYEKNFGDGWNWPGSSNGEFIVFAGQTADVIASPNPVILPAFGTRDLRLTLDYNNLDTSATWANNTVTVKSKAWSWGEIDVKGTLSGGVYTFTLSNFIGAGKPLIHTGPLLVGAQPEFIWKLGGKEYKNSSNVALTAGVNAFSKDVTGATWNTVVVGLKPNNNTYVTIP